MNNDPFLAAQYMQYLQGTGVPPEEIEQRLAARFTPEAIAGAKAGGGAPGTPPTAEPPNGEEFRVSNPGSFEVIDRWNPDTGQYERDTSRALPIGGNTTVNVAAPTPPATGGVNEEQLNATVAEARSRGLIVYQVGPSWFIEDPRTGKGVQLDPLRQGVYDAKSYDLKDPKATSTGKTNPQLERIQQSNAMRAMLRGDQPDASPANDRSIPGAPAPMRSPGAEGLSFEGPGPGEQYFSKPSIAYGVNPASAGGGRVPAMVNIPQGEGGTMHMPLSPTVLAQHLTSGGQATTGDPMKDLEHVQDIWDLRAIFTGPKEYGGFGLNPLAAQELFQTGVFGDKFQGRSQYLDESNRNMGSSGIIPSPANRDLLEKFSPAELAELFKSIPEENFYQAGGGQNMAGSPRGAPNGFSTQNPIYMVDARTGRPLAIAGEAGPERIDVTPMGPVPMALGGTGITGQPGPRPTATYNGMRGGTSLPGQRFSQSRAIPDDWQPPGPGQDPNDRDAKYLGFMRDNANARQMGYRRNGFGAPNLIFYQGRFVDPRTLTPEQLADYNLMKGGQPDNLPGNADARAVEAWWAGGRQEPRPFAQGGSMMVGNGAPMMNPRSMPIMKPPIPTDPRHDDIMRKTGSRLLADEVVKGEKRKLTTGVPK